MVPPAASTAVPALIAVHLNVTVSICDRSAGPSKLMVMNGMTLSTFVADKTGANVLGVESALAAVALQLLRTRPVGMLLNCSFNCVSAPGAPVGLTKPPLN